MKVITIGRDPGNDVPVNDNTVSRHHCQIIQKGGQIRLADFGSCNGTFVNGVPIKGEVYLKPGDVVRIGNTVLPWERHVSGSDLPSTVILQGSGAPNVYSPPPQQPVIFQQAPFIPENLNINKREEHIHADVYKKGDDFIVPFKRNVGKHAGNALGGVAGCLIWLIAIIAIGGIIALVAS